MESSGGIKGYTILEELGKGGFATVYKVRDNEFGYIRAIRVLHEPILNEDSVTYRKFKRECEVLLRLGNGNHPNIIHICRPLLVNSLAMVEMDYINGLDIGKYIEREKGFVDVKEVINMAAQISSALAYCHEDIYKACMDRDIDNLQDDPEDGSKVIIDEETRKRLIEKYKVIHNDIHAGNIMRSNNGNYILLDFGLAINGSEVVRSSSRHTNGSPEFKAPEKWNNELLLTEQSDIYSFGCVMYMMLAGRVPFEYNISLGRIKADNEIFKAHEQTPPPSIEAFRKERYEQKFEGKQYKRDFPQWLENAIMQCLEKNPDDRFKNGKELYDYIKSHLDKMTISEEKPEERHKKTSKQEFDDDEITYLVGKNKDLKEQNTGLFNAYSRLNRENTALQKELDDVKDELRREKEAYKFLKRQYERLNPLAYKILISVFVVLTVLAFIIVGVKSSTIEEKNQTIAEKDRIHFRDSVKINSLSDKIEALEYTNDSLIVANQQLDEVGNQTTGDYKALQKQNYNLSRENAQLQATIYSLRNEVNRKDLDVQIRDRQIDSLDRQIDYLKQQVIDK